MKAIERTLNRWLRPHTAFPYTFYYVDHAHRLIYLAIPKNAKSYLRSVFLAAHPEVDDFDPQAETVVQYLRRAGARHVRLQNPRLLRDPGYRRMVVLRHPFERLVSGFLDKFVKPIAAGHAEAIDRRTLAQVQRVRGRHVTPQRLSFADLALTVSTLPTARVDDHYRPQAEFLNGHHFDFYGDFAELGRTLAYLRTLGVNPRIRRTRSAKRTRYAPSDQAGNRARTPAAELVQLGAFPTARAFLSAEVSGALGRLYAEDLALYTERAGGDA